MVATVRLSCEQCCARMLLQDALGKVRVKPHQLVGDCIKVPSGTGYLKWPKVVEFGSKEVWQHGNASQ